MKHAIPKESSAAPTRIVSLTGQLLSGISDETPALAMWAGSVRHPRGSFKTVTSAMQNCPQARVTGIAQRCPQCNVNAVRHLKSSVCSPGREVSSRELSNSSVNAVLLNALILKAWLLNERQFQTLKLKVM